ncbi:MAG: hypothetical protein JWR69_3153 [Pedosphaera sp.]|nr:hypothetical protein [Pedosphaera sp.]
MGWDSIEYAGNHEQFHDGILWILRHFLLLEARAMESAQPGSDSAELRAFVEGWDWLCPGVVIGTDFSSFVQDTPSRWRLLLDLLQRGGDRIASFGESVPKAYLEVHTSERGGGYTRDFPTKRLLTDIGRMCRLLGQHEPRM